MNFLKKVRKLNSQPNLTFWLASTLAIVLIKLIVIILDPHPQFFLGDSYVYLTTALSDSKPMYQSYWYGALIRWAVGSTQSLFPLILLQSFFGVVSTLLAGFISHRVFRPGCITIFLVILACSLDPSQLMFERYVLTESSALIAFSIMMTAIVLVLTGGNWPWMAVAGIFGVVIVSLRASLFPAVLVSLLLTPVIGMWTRELSLRSMTLSLAIGFIACLSCWSVTSSIKSGQFVLAAWSPLLVAQDFPDVEQGARFMKDMDLAGTGFFTREITLHRQDGMMQRIRNELGDLSDVDRFSKKVSLNILARDFPGVLKLALSTYVSVWNAETRYRLMQWDIGQNELSPLFREQLAQKFRHIAEELPSPTLTSKAYLGIGHSAVTLCLLAPLLFVTVIPSAQKNLNVGVIVLFAVVSASMLFTISIFSTQPVVRYLHQIGWLVIALVPAGISKIICDPTAAWRR